MNKNLPETEKVFPKELWIDTLKTDEAINLIIENQKKQLMPFQKLETIFTMSLKIFLRVYRTTLGH